MCCCSATPWRLRFVHSPCLGTDTCRLLATGCCCYAAVRGDLIRILNKLAKRRNKFDHILIETTGK
jgi:G3E family GTPase